MSSERSMYDCLLEQLEVLREAIRVHASACGETLQTWYEAGASFAAFSDLDPAKQDEVAYAWGYLNGAADLANLTVEGVLEEHGLSFDRKPDPVYRCACSWVGGDPDITSPRSKKPPTCPACWKHDRKRVVVAQVTR
jgi:hypothetical protein